jgi:hypothetical protein
MFVPHGKHAYGTPQSVTTITLLLYMKMFVPHRKQIPTGCYVDSFTFIYI